MKRRDFLKGTLMALGLTTVLAKSAGLFNEALAAVVWVKPGTLGYKEVAPAPQVKAGKQCSTCSWFKADAAGGAGSGQCTLKAMQTASKAPAAYVKAAGYCNMWKKKA
jgi:hypothetical protein